MDSPDGAPEWLEVRTAEESPARWAQERDEGRFLGVWPEYNLHARLSGAYFGTLSTRFPGFQALFVDRRSDEAVARGRTIPVRWDGSAADLPDGIDDAGLRGIGDEPPTVLCALAAEVVPGLQGQGLSRLVVATMVELARRHSLRGVIAPVRPNRKDRYPLVPIERYRHWRRADGLPFDPWLRVHARLGGVQLRAAPRSMLIEAPVADWTAWTGLELPEDGTYVFDGGLAPLRVEGGVGTYHEPNVWVLHRVDPSFALGFAPPSG